MENYYTLWEKTPDFSFENYNKYIEKKTSEVSKENDILTKKLIASLVVNTNVNDAIPEIKKYFSVIYTPQYVARHMDFSNAKEINQHLYAFYEQILIDTGNKYICQITPLHGKKGLIDFFIESGIMGTKFLTPRGIELINELISEYKKHTFEHTLSLYGTYEIKLNDIEKKLFQTDTTRLNIYTNGFRNVVIKLPKQRLILKDLSDDTHKISLEKAFVLTHNEEINQYFAQFIKILDRTIGTHTPFFEYCHNKLNPYYILYSL